MTDKNWKQKLQDKMAHYEEPAPDGLWESIEREMPAVSPTHTDRRHTVSLWLGRLAGAAAAIALVVLLGKVWRNASTEVTLMPTPMATTEVAPSPTTSAAPHTTDILSEKPATTILSARIPEAPRLLAKADVNAKNDAYEVEQAMPFEEARTVEEAPAKAESVITSEAPAETEAPKAPQNETKATEAPARTTASNVQRSNTSLWPTTTVASRKSKNGRLTATLYASGTATDREIQRSYNLPYGYGSIRNMGADAYGHAHGDSQGIYLSGSTALGGGISNEITNPDVPYPGINSYNKNGIAENSAMVRSTSNRALIESSYADYKHELKHHQPLRGGISLRYHLSDRVAIESGVTYTRMESEATEGKSETTEGGPANYYRTTQTLHYIGIPVNVLFTLWNPKAFEVYVLGGGMAEKNVKGKQESTYTVSEQELIHQTNRFTEKPLQWSVNAGAGVQYNLNNAFGLYAEPGVSYYIDNKSKVDNYYKDKPWSFNLKIGLRYSFNR